MSRYSSAVDRGIDFLDRNYPGWEDKIDLNVLDISSNCMCVMGQVSGGYSNLYHMLDPLSDFTGAGSNLGFALPSGVHGTHTDEMIDVEYNKLRDVWVSRIKDRRELNKELEDIEISTKELVAV